MIFFLNGRLDSARDGFLLMDVQGVGYQVFVTERTQALLPRVGDALRLYTYHLIREDQQALYGFLKPDERKFFAYLLTLSGVGPKVALSILSYFTIPQFLEAIVAKRASDLTQVPGVGKKMAERLVLELKDKVDQLYPSADMAAFAAGTAPDSLSPDVEQDLLLALKALGYGTEEIRRRVRACAAELQGVSLEQGIKLLLKQLS